MRLRALLLFSLAWLPHAVALAADDWGVYPDCVAPAVPLEVQGWWWQDGEAFPRHLHHAACVPNARTDDCSDGRNPILEGRHPFTSRIVTYNNPSEVKWVRWQWQSDTQERVDVHRRCEDGTVVSEGLEQCVWTEEMTLDPAAGNGGLDELRMSPNISENDLGKRQFATLNFQVCTGTGSNGYRSAPDPIGRGWYEGVEYSNVRVNYMDFYEGSLDEVIPTVRGVVTLDIDHQRGSGENRSLLWLDTNHHKNPGQFGSPPPVGEVQPHGGVLLYDEPGLFDGTFDWDTTGLEDGVHTLFFQTTSRGSDGVSVAGLKLLFNVDNGNPSEPVIVIDHVSVAEGDSGNAEAVFTGTLLFGNDREARVDYATADDTARAGEDYQPTTGRLTFSAAAPTQTLRVLVSGDETVEGDETFVVNLFDPVNAKLAYTEAVATILDDDARPQQYTVSVSSRGDGSVALDPAGGLYEEGSAVTLVATPAAGFVFIGWAGDLTGTDNPATLSVDADKTVTAQFAESSGPTVELSVRTRGSGSVALDPPGGVYREGSVVTLTARPDPGFRFKRWRGDLSGSENPANLRMDSNKRVRAIFRRQRRK